MQRINYLESTENHVSSSGKIPQDTLQWIFLREIQLRVTTRRTRPEEFEVWIIFTSMFNDIVWTKNGNYKECFSNSEI